MLTKEECEKALDRVARFCSWFNPYKCPKCIKFKNELDILDKLIEEHFENPQIDWLKNCMGEEAFNLIFSSQEEVNKWFDRMRWHVKKCDEYGRELDILKNNPPLKFEELQERETYYHIYYGWISIRSIIDCECILINTLNSDGYKQIEFEEDCFYRKEVVE